MLDLKKSLA